MMMGANDVANASWRGVARLNLLFVCGLFAKSESDARVGVKKGQTRQRSLEEEGPITLRESMDKKDPAFGDCETRSFGTSVGSGAVTMRQAVVIAAVMNLAGAVSMSSAVTETIRKGIVDLERFAPSGEDEEGDPKALMLVMLSAMLGPYPAHSSTSRLRDSGFYVRGVCRRRGVRGE